MKRINFIGAINVTEFTALNKSRCPGVTQDPKRTKLINATKQILETITKSSGMIIYEHLNI